MNINVFLRCNHCDDLIHTRIGFSNQEIQIFRFACFKCKSPIIINLTVDFDNVTWEGKIEGGVEVKDMWPDKVDQSDQFVDLHLDFPTYYGKYEMGVTPFLRAHTKLKDNLLPYEHALKLLQIAVDDADSINAIIRFYLGGDMQLFEKNIRKYLDEKDFPCKKPVDINRALYQFLCIAFMAINDPLGQATFVESVHQKLCELYQENEKNFGLFLEYIIQVGFLANIQRDCLELYPRIIEANEILRPALYYEFVDDENKNTCLRIGNSDFLKHKTLFQDISEVISRQLVLVAGINNIVKRGHYDLFDTNIKKHPESLNEFANYPFGRKSEYIDDPYWGPIASKVIMNRLRNAIAHNKVEYNESTQEIEFYFKLEGMKQEQHDQMTYMDFTITLLESFRWMNKFNHLIKMLYVFWYLRYELRDNVTS